MALHFSTLEHFENNVSSEDQANEEEYDFEDQTNNNNFDDENENEVSQMDEENNEQMDEENSDSNNSNNIDDTLESCMAKCAANQKYSNNENNNNEDDEVFEQFSNMNNNNMNNVAGRSLWSLDLLLKSILFACLFYVLGHSKTRTFVSKNIVRGKENGAYVLMAVFAVLFYLLNLVV